MRLQRVSVPRAMGRSASVAGADARCRTNSFLMIGRIIAKNLSRDELLPFGATSSLSYTLLV